MSNMEPNAGRMNIIMMRKTVVITLLSIVFITLHGYSYVCAAEVHSYYNGVPAEGAALADAIAQNIAASIMSNPAYTTDLQRVDAAAEAVFAYTQRGVYGVDPNKYYRTPYGVFCTGNYTCAGTTRALGRVLDYMDYQYIHINPNQWTHQWNVLVMDGQVGFADGIAGYAGYGEYVSGTVIKGRTVRW